VSLRVSWIGWGVSLQRIRSEIERYATRSEARYGAEMQLTSRAKRVIDLAYDEARQLNNNYIGTEHLLLGLIREGEGLAARVLHKLGVDIERARREVMNLQEHEGHSAPASRPQRSRTPTLDEFGRDLTEMARQGKLDPVIGRHNEVERVMQILARRTKNNPVLVGPPGVGKTAIVRGAGAAASCKAMCPTSCATSASSRSILQGWSQARSIAASSRSA
jgi:ATP-dependent Clp protease ATP-binding subunit ClpC